MKNVEMKVDGGKLVVVVDLSKDFGKSASGKSTIIASSCGNVALPSPHESVKIGLNVYKN